MIALTVIISFFVGRATSLPWLIKYHVRHIKDSEIIRLTYEKESLEERLKIAEKDREISVKKLKAINSIMGAEE
jgi:hypothetical protein